MLSARNRVAFFSAICALALSSLALAQSPTTGRIAGVVKDQNGALIAGAEVSVLGRARGVERKVTSAETGSYGVPLLPARTYTVKVTGRGYDPNAENAQVNIT